MMQYPISLELSLSPEDVLQRLKAETTEVRSMLFTFPPASDNCFISKFDGNRFQMRVKHWYSNGLTSFLHGEVIPTDTGCRLVARYKILKSVQGTLVVIMGYWVIGGFYASWVRVVGGNQFHGCELLMIELAVSMCLFFGLLIAIARALGRADERMMTAFLIDLFTRTV